MPANDEAELIIGIMSGTSIDGIDVAIVEFQSASKLKVVQTEFYPFGDELRAAISAIALNNSKLRQEQDSPLHDQLANIYAQAAQDILSKTGLEKEKISAIANHGQTVKHAPEATPPYSLQLGNGQLIANQTGIPTITRFRQADLAAGGQGAPLMPAFHNAIFDRADDSFILNLGGIANITRLGKEVIGFDTGPSNCLLDQWINEHLGKRFDDNGEWAASGEVIEAVLATLMKDPYLHQAYPKSTGTDHYNLTWLKSKISNLHDFKPVDVQATLMAFTVKTVALALQQLQAPSGEIYVCGGGAQNHSMIGQLQQALPEFKISKTDKLGIPSDWVEAVGFAWLGYCKIHGTVSNQPSVTGARSSQVLGQMYLPTKK